MYICDPEGQRDEGIALEMNALQMTVCSEHMIVGVAVQKKTTIHQIITMHATSKVVLYPGHNHLLTTCTDDPCWWSGDNQSVGSLVLVVSRCL